MHSSADTTIESGDALEVLHITDNHLFTNVEGGRHGFNSLASLRAVLETALAERQPDVVVVTGDVANDSNEEIYETFLTCMREFTSCDYIATPGNHDLGEPFSKVLTSSTVEKKGWRIVAVDTHQDGELAGFVSTDALTELDLEVSASTKPTLVVGHHPATDIDCEWIDHNRISNGEALIDQLASHDHVKAYLCGHVHQAFDGECQGLVLMTTPSTCWQFKPQTTEFAIDEVPAGWRWLSLMPDGSFDTTVYRLEETA